MDAAGKPAYKRLWDFLGSRDLSVFVFIMGMTYFLILIAFSTVIPLFWVDGISKLLPYKVLYLLFFINLLICEIKWIPVVARRCRKLSPPVTDGDLQRLRHRMEFRGSELDVQRLARALRRRGYSVSSLTGSQWAGAAGGSGPLHAASGTSPVLYACRGRFSPIGSLLFHFGFFFLLAGAGLGMLYHFDGTVLLAEGQGITGTGEEYISSTSTELLPPPKISFEVEKITPVFWKDVLLFEELKAGLSYMGGKSEVGLGQPLRLDGTRVSITGMGITTSYMLRGMQGNELDSGYVNLNIFTPGAEDQFRLPRFPYRVNMSFYPDFELRGGRPASRSMKAVNPVYDVKVFGPSRRLFKGFVKPGEEAVFDGLRLSFPEFKYCGIFRVVYDAGFGFIWTGFLLMAMGLVWRSMFYRKEILVLVENDGGSRVSGYSEHHPNLFAAELRKLAGLHP